MYTWKFLTSYNFPGAAKKNVEMHYNRGEDIYDWMLDQEHRQYSCGIFKNSNESLEQAQTNKLSHIAKKLDLKPGHSVLDIGCGWGGLSRYLAKLSGCQVHGVTLSSNQLAHCKEKARESKLDNLLSYELCDYRNVTGKYDRLTNIGFLEHVSPKFYKTFFKKISDLMKDDAICLTHTIASTKPPYAANPFINKYIFSGGKIPVASQLTKAIEQTNLVISGWESLIDHYNLTLDQWRKRFLENAGKAKKKYGDEFIRLWDYYLSSCSAAFKWSDLLVYQIEIVKNFSSTPSRTRDYIYQ
jgi:cyclopropane-fatty-acyl-phospholipid synthase